MQVDVARILVDYDMKPLEFRPEPQSPVKFMQVKDVLVPPLLAPQKSLGWEEHLKRDELARKIYRADGPIEILAEEIALLKKSICSAGFSSIAVVQVGKILEGQL